MDDEDADSSGDETDEDEDISTWLPADPHHPMYARYVDDVQYTDAVDRRLVVAALDALLVHDVHADPVVWDALALVPSGSYRRDRQSFVDIQHRRFGTSLLRGYIEQWRHGRGMDERWTLGRTITHRQGGPAQTHYLDEKPFGWDWHVYGAVHRDGAPARDYLHDDGTAAQAWYVRDAEQRSDGPYQVQWHANGSVSRAVRAADGGSGEDERELLREWYPSGGVKRVTFYKGWAVHRRTGPAYVDYDADGRVCVERWAQDGIATRCYGPAVRCYTRGVLTGEEWRIGGWLRRPLGPAFWRRTPDGMLHELWTTQDWRNGVMAQYIITDRNGRATRVVDATHPSSLWPGLWWPADGLHVPRAHVTGDFVLLVPRPPNGDVIHLN